MNEQFVGSRQWSVMFNRRVVQVWTSLGVPARRPAVESVDSAALGNPRQIIWAFYFEKVPLRNGCCFWPLMLCARRGASPCYILNKNDHALRFIVIESLRFFPRSVSQFHFIHRFFFCLFVYNYFFLFIIKFSLLLKLCS